MTFHFTFHISYPFHRQSAFSITSPITWSQTTAYLSQTEIRIKYQKYQNIHPWSLSYNNQRRIVIMLTTTPAVYLLLGTHYWPYRPTCNYRVSHNCWLIISKQQVVKGEVHHHKIIRNIDKNKNLRQSLQAYRFETLF